MWGNIGADGSVHSGSGDSLAEMDSTGRYVITFQRGFRTPLCRNADAAGSSIVDLRSFRLSLSQDFLSPCSGV
ncbi:hypothetical protein [Streptomyces flaveolus]|uniref:hypothetical protein n=1 Tax=Streptomyces flaveolus TaxID=67297 RepID=UPI0036F8E145